MGCASAATHHDRGYTRSQKGQCILLYTWPLMELADLGILTYL